MSTIDVQWREPREVTKQIQTGTLDARTIEILCTHEALGWTVTVSTSNNESSICRRLPGATIDEARDEGQRLALGLARLLAPAP